jgi:hypothetical protein
VLDVMRSRHLAGSQAEVFLDRFVRLWAVWTDPTRDDVDLLLAAAGERSVGVMRIRRSQAERGAGSRALDLLARCADEAGIALWLLVQPVPLRGGAPAPLDAAALAAYYARRGFVRQAVNVDVMIRSPKGRENEDSGR